jgi:hypothetical protein
MVDANNIPVPPPSKSRGGLLVWCCGGCGVVAFIVIVAVILGAGSFYRWGVTDDLGEYRDAVRSSTLPQAQKAALTAQIDRVEARAKQGKLPGFLQWVEHDKQIDLLIRDGDISKSDAQAIGRELDAVEREQQ